jgi:chemotaxis family two-component system sensor kinase Cph1
MIQQVFSNLLGNAVKYSSKTGAPMVTVIGEHLEDQVRYRVSDNGIGVKLKDLEKIFDLFTRSDEVDAYEGSGVGLAIVKKIMEKHQGRIWVESEPGLGATFHVTFQTALKEIA